MQSDGTFRDGEGLLTTHSLDLLGCTPPPPMTVLARDESTPYYIPNLRTFRIKGGTSQRMALLDFEMFRPEARSLSG